MRTIIFVLVVLLTINVVAAQPAISGVSVIPSGHISDQDTVTISFTTSMPTTAEVDCSGLNKGTDNILRAAHSISVGKFSLLTSPINVRCTINAWDNESNSATETKEFYVYSKNPYLEVSSYVIPYEQKVVFNMRKSQCRSIVRTPSFKIENSGLLPINTITITTEGSTANWITISPGSISSIAGLESTTFSVTITVPCNAPEGYNSGKIKVDTNNAGSREIDVSVDVEFPINIEIVGASNFGKLMSGNSYTKTFTVRETYGYKVANKVNINLEGIGFTRGFSEAGISNVKLSPAYLENVGSSGGTISLYFDVPKRGTNPGIYSGNRITAEHSSGRNSIDLSFEIPSPKMEISKFNFNFPDIEGGKKATDIFTVRETEGYTTIDGFKINVNKCTRADEGKTEDYQGGINWVSFSDVAYIPPGKSQSIEISIDVPGSYQTGNYMWEGTIKTNYAGKNNITIKGIACEPFIKENIKTLQNMNLEGSLDKLRRDIVSLLKNMCDKRISKNDADTVTNSAKTLLESLNNVKKGYTVDSDYKQLIFDLNKIIEEFDDLKSKCKVLEYTYPGDVGNIQNSSDMAIKEVGALVAGLHQTEAINYEPKNYKNSIQNYDKCANISQLTKIYGKGDDCAEGRNRMMQKHDESISNAENEIIGAERLQGEVNAMLWFNGSNYNFIARVVDYNNVVDRYSKLISNYNDAINQYHLAGEEDNASKIRKIFNEKQSEKSRVEYTTWAVCIMLLVLLIMFVFFIAYKIFVNERIVFLIKGKLGFILLSIMILVFTAIFVLNLPMVLATLLTIVLAWSVISALRYLNDIKKISLNKVVKS